MGCAFSLQLTAEDEERLANCACWESIELPPIKVALSNSCCVMQNHTSPLFRVW